MNPHKVKPIIKVLGSAAPVHKGVERFFSDLDRAKQPIAYGELAKIIERQCDGTIFVLDNSFIPRHEIDFSVWEALLRKRVVIPPFVWLELQDWLADPFSNKHMAPLFQQAKGSQTSRIILDHESKWPPDYFLAREYYVALLSDRKQRAHQIVKGFISKNGRPPNDKELQKLWQQHGNERDFHLLRKGYTDLAKPNFFADEDVIVTATMIAVLGGCDTVVLTRDADLLDQFDKFNQLITLHYQALLFAEQYARTTNDFITLPMPVGIRELEGFFIIQNCILVRKHVDDPDLFIETILPKNYQPVQVTCCLLSGAPPDMTRSFIRFQNELDVKRLFDVKGKTKGLSTDALGGRNCHVSGFPIGIENPRQWIIVGEDKSTLLPSNGVKIAHLDRAHTNYHFEIRTRAHDQQH